MTFEDWFARVNAICLSRTGLECDDFPDTCYWDMWDDGETPQEAFDRAMEDAGYAGLF